MNRKEIISFVKENFNSVNDYVKGISRRGIINELKEFNIIIPSTLLSTKAIKEIYRIVLEDIINRQ